MSKKGKQQIKLRLHPRNKNRESYNLEALINIKPELEDFIEPNKYGGKSVDFSEPEAVKLLNQAILNYYYGIEFWEFSDRNLCPPIPGRADYLHYMADLLAEGNSGKIPLGDKITCLDIGTGASCIYPLLGVSEYQWNFIASDVELESVKSARDIVQNNPSLTNKVDCRLQTHPDAIFRGVVDPGEKIDLSICNPPFYASLADAQKESQRKARNLRGVEDKNPRSGFSGVSNELIYKGGEFGFIQNMLKESRELAKSCFWFSTLVSKESLLKKITIVLEKSGVRKVKVIPMGTGNKSSRIIAWTFLSEKEQREWARNRWK